MRKDELVAGEAYSAGDTDRYAEWRRVRVVVVEVDGRRGRQNGTTARGIVVRIDPPVPREKLPYSIRREHAGSDELVLKTGRNILSRWEPFAANLAEHQKAQAAAGAEKERRRELLARASITLRDSFAVDPETAHSGARLDPRLMRLALDAEVAEELFRRFEPMGVAGSAIEAFIGELDRRELLAVTAMNPSPEELARGLDAARVAALETVRASLAVTDAELRVPPAEVDEDGFEVVDGEVVP